ncbi:MAG: hypothetical protein HC782_05080 [Gammaproteobacteria bacterium]|nr:hypothetical protein [Gammaproteobacteria bacterium]
MTKRGKKPVSCDYRNATKRAANGDVLWPRRGRVAVDGVWRDCEALGVPGMRTVVTLSICLPNALAANLPTTGNSRYASGNTHYRIVDSRRCHVAWRFTWLKMCEEGIHIGLTKIYKLSRQSDDEL